MAFFRRLSQETIRNEFTHYGSFGGLVPCYVRFSDNGIPGLMEQNWVPTWYFTVMTWLWQEFGYVTSFLMPDFQPSFILRIDGEIPGAVGLMEKKEEGN